MDQAIGNEDGLCTQSLTSILRVISLVIFEKFLHVCYIISISSICVHGLQFSTTEAVQLDTLHVREAILLASRVLGPTANPGVAFYLVLPSYLSTPPYRVKTLTLHVLNLPRIGHRKHGRQLVGLRGKRQRAGGGIACQTMQFASILCDIAIS